MFNWSKTLIDLDYMYIEQVFQSYYEADINQISERLYERPVIKKVVYPSFELGKYHFLGIYTAIVNFLAIKKSIFLFPHRLQY